MQRLARLAVYATAIVIVFTARSPVQVPAAAALRVSSPDAILGPVRILIATVLLAGLLIELMRRRPVWH